MPKGAYAAKGGSSPERFPARQRRQRIDTLRYARFMCEWGWASLEPISIHSAQESGHTARHWQPTTAPVPARGGTKQLWVGARGSNRRRLPESPLQSLSITVAQGLGHQTAPQECCWAPVTRPSQPTAAWATGSTRANGASVRGPIGQRVDSMSYRGSVLAEGILKVRVGSPMT